MAETGIAGTPPGVPQRNGDSAVPSLSVMPVPGSIGKLRIPCDSAVFLPKSSARIGFASCKERLSGTCATGLPVQDYSG